jgi:hypothetical protein
MTEEPASQMFASCVGAITPSQYRFPNAKRIAELAIEKQAQTLLIPVAARK